MLYLLRHGQTDWNKQRRLQGKTDIPLNETGREQAAFAGEKYADLSIDECFVSPLGRAVETAGIFLGNRDVPIYSDERLSEMGFGRYEGYQQTDGVPVPAVYNFLFHPESFVAEEGMESIDEMYLRTRAFLLEQIYPRIMDNRNILVVGHGAMCLGIINQIYNIPKGMFWKELMKNCEVYNINNVEIINFAEKGF